MFARGRAGLRDQFSGGTDLCSGLKKILHAQDQNCGRRHQAQIVAGA
jgi:hypothetical protein